VSVEFLYCEEYKKMTTENTVDLEEEMRAFKTEMKAELHESSRVTPPSNISQLGMGWNIAT
jgi:hypothetical protein